jgi:hypothetical protein
MKSKWVWALFAVVLSAGIWGGTLMATNPSGLGTTTLAKSRFDEINVKAQAIPASIWKTKIRTHGLSDVYVVDNKLAPVDPNTGLVANSGWHSHPGPSLIFVVAGTVTNYSSEDRTCAGQKYSMGQGFIDSGKDVHILRNEGSVLAETIAVQLLPANTASRRIDQPAPGNCPF